MLQKMWAAQWWQDFILKDKAAKLVTDKKIPERCSGMAKCHLIWMDLGS